MRKTEHQIALLKSMRKRQESILKTLKNSTPSIGDSLENCIRAHLDSKRMLLEKHLQQYDFPEALRLNILGITIDPIVQLAETNGLGAAHTFAERIKSYEHNNQSYIELFNTQISKLKLKPQPQSKSTPQPQLNSAPFIPLPEQQLNLQIAIAHLASIFSYRYSLFAIHSNKFSHDLIDKERQGQLRNDIAIYIVAVITEIVLVIEQVAKSKKLKLAQLKNDFLTEESTATADQRWEKTIKQKDQTEEDAKLAQEYGQETFNVINFEISNCLQARHIDAEQFKLWLNKGIHFITCRDNESCIRNLEVNDYYLNSSRWLGEELQASLNRYLELYNDVVLLRKLAKNNLILTLENVLALSSESKFCLQDLSPYSKERMSLSKWTFAMADNIAKFNRLLIYCPYFSDFEFFKPYSRQQINQYLDLLLKNNISTDINSRHESLKMLVSPSSDFEQVKRLLTIPFLFKQSRREMNTIQMQPFLQELSSTSKKCLFSTLVTTDLLNFLKELSGISVSQQRIDLILSSAYLLSGKPRINSPLISFVLKTTRPDSHLQSVFCTADEPMIALRAVVFSVQGTECHTKGYCDFNSQLDLDFKALPLLQKIMLHKKAPLNMDSLKLLSSPDMLSAFEANFFDIGYIAACKPKELEEIASAVHKARRNGIKDAWDPRFGKLINKRSKQTFFKESNSLPEKIAENPDSIPNQSSEQSFFKPSIIVVPDRIVANPKKPPLQLAPM